MQGLQQIQDPLSGAMPGGMPTGMQGAAIPDPPPFPTLVETQSPDGFLHYGLLEIWADWYLWIIIPLVLLIALQIYRIKRNKKRRIAQPLSQKEIALNAIAALRAENPDLKQAAVDLSLILRRYLVGETNDPALFETQQEFNRRANALITLPESMQNPTHALLDRMAALKYEPNTTNSATAVQELADSTVTLIKDIEAATRRPTEETDLFVHKHSSK